MTNGRQLSSVVFYLFIFILIFCKMRTNKIKLHCNYDLMSYMVVNHVYNNVKKRIHLRVVSAENAIMIEK